MENIVILTGLVFAAAVVIVTINTIENRVSGYFDRRNCIIRKDPPCMLPGAETFLALKGKP